MKLIYGMTLRSLFDEAAEKYPHNKLIVHMSESWTYSETAEIVYKLARGLRAIGLGKGDFIGLLGKDRPYTFFLFMAIEQIGAVTVFFNSSWHEREVREQIEKIGIDFLFADPDFCGKDIWDNSRVLLITKSTLLLLEEKGVSENESKEEVTLSAEDPDVVLFTSGSSGCPNGVLTTHFSRVNSAFAQAEMICLKQDDIVCVCIPMFHCFSLSSNILAPLTCGACICFPKDRHTINIYSAVQNHHCTVLTAVPTLYSALLANPEKDQFDISSLRVGIIGGAGVANSLFLKIQREMDFKLIPSLGQTEATSGITASRYDDSNEDKLNTVGYMLPDIEWKVASDGELCIRGYNVMQGYVNNPELTAKTIDADGYLHTGDTCTVDENGKVRLLGRKKEIIIRGGENISPAELECTLMADERILFAKVLGVPDEHYGEEVCAVIRCNENIVMTEDEVRGLIYAELAAYKVPKYVKFIERMPLIGNNKVDVQTLKQLIKDGKI